MITIKNQEIDVNELLLASIEHPIATLSKQDIEKIINRNNDSQTKEKGGE